MQHISQTDNYWFLDPIDCDVAGMTENNCTLLINAFNGRVLYDHVKGGDYFGASPEVVQGGTLPSYVYDNKGYRWKIIDADAR